MLYGKSKKVNAPPKQIYACKKKTKIYITNLNIQF